MYQINTMSDLQFTNIKDVRPGQKNLNVIFIALEIDKPNRTKDNHDVRCVKGADKTGSINLSIWDEAGDIIQTGDICKLIKGYATPFKGCLTLYTGKGGKIIKIGEFCLQFSELPNMSEFNSELVQNKQQQNEQNQTSQQRRSPTEQGDQNQNQDRPRSASQSAPNGQRPMRPMIQGQEPNSRGRSGRR